MALQTWHSCVSDYPSLPSNMDCSTSMSVIVSSIFMKVLEISNLCKSLDPFTNRFLSHRIIWFESIFILLPFVDMTEEQVLFRMTLTLVEEDQLDCTVWIVWILGLLWPLGGYDGIVNP